MNDNGLLAAYDCSDPTAGGYVAGTLVIAGLGAAIGVGVDALIHNKREIYRRGAHVTAAPAEQACEARWSQ